MNSELYHFGVKGMKWGKRKAIQYTNKAKTARSSAREWDQMAKYAQQKGKLKRAERFHKYANKDRRDAYKLDKKAAYVQTPEAAKKRIRNKLLRSAAGAAIGTGVVLAAPKILANKKVQSLLNRRKFNPSNFRAYKIT